MRLSEACEEYYSAQLMIPYYKAMLDDPTLADSAAALTDEHTGEIMDIAIPVGGKRKGGILEMSLKPEYAKKVADMLRSNPGFPNARVMYDCHVVWGETPPGDARHMDAATVIARGRHFGYSEKAIREGVKAFRHPRGARRGINRLYRRVVDLRSIVEKLRAA